MISIHAPLTGCDVERKCQEYMSMRISIHAPLTGCDDMSDDGYKLINISIHAPLTGCDFSVIFITIYNFVFQSTHPLRDATYDKFVKQQKRRQFQSTHPLRDATGNTAPLLDTLSNFNPRTPYGMRQTESLIIILASLISIHAPLTGCDLI